MGLICHDSVVHISRIHKLKKMSERKQMQNCMLVSLLISQRGGGGGGGGRN